MACLSFPQRLRGPIAKAVGEKLHRKNPHALPAVGKVVVAVGINKSRMDSKETHEYVEGCLMKITGQKPVFTRARKAIANFKVRAGLVVGAKVTLRGRHMEEFLDRFLSYALPRIRDFRGLPARLDGHGNYCIGIRDHSIFPEVPPPDANQIFGLEVQITTTAKTDEEALVLLREMGVPFRREGKEGRADRSPPVQAVEDGEGKEGKGRKAKKAGGSVDPCAHATDTEADSAS